jgi:excisionase family DNA binding protein
MSRVLKVGECANYCRVAPRTVTKWIDSGRLKGYRLPGSQDRRVDENDLIEFMEKYELPIPEQLQKSTCLLREAISRAISELDPAMSSQTIRQLRDYLIVTLAK